MGKLEVENVTINRINESENIDAMEDINLQSNHSGNDTSFCKDISGTPVLEAEVREKQAKRALEKVLILSSISKRLILIRLKHCWDV
jgi:hypothetical protein